MNLSNRRGMELAANTVVILIVSIAILTIGTFMTYSIVCEAEQFTLQVDAQNEKRLEQLMSTGGTLVVADNEKKAKRQGSALCGSNPEEVASFAIAIRNIESTPLDLTLRVRGILDPDGNPQQVSDWDLQSFVLDNPVTMAPGEKSQSNLIVKAPGTAVQGQYSISIAVEDTAVPRILAVETLLFTVD